MKKLSVRTKYALALVAILVVLMGSQLAVNRLLVPRFYLNQKLDRIEEIRLSVLDYIEKCGSAETLDDAELSLTTMCEAAGVDAMIMKMSGGMPVIVFSNSLEQVGGPGRLFDFMRGKQNQDNLSSCRFPGGPLPCAAPWALPKSACKKARWRLSTG